ncbi:MAG: NFYB/HAP3 family transcription factor subunit [Candidatus Micrarchaeota archaeon]|nr:NFYB/HAP3 family transcription factor subunit [Candidatus Micrarchaeota archaeon]
MRNISKATIKKIVKNGSNPNVIISDKAAEAIARILESKAKRIAKYAVKRAKAKKRNTITEDDIDTYTIMHGD